LIFKHVEYHLLFWNGSSSTFSTANPGYLQGANILAGIGNGSAIQYDMNSFLVSIQKKTCFVFLGQQVLHNFQFYNQHQMVLVIRLLNVYQLFSVKTFEQRVNTSKKFHPSLHFIL